ncbi:Aspartate aminotransferase [Spironucleus salmonicida]|uniref:Aspartate aminotransferase n=1 Tax=Spironucleus salmonicida TaxID=348837 RepID=V6LHY8_9EUKA|nr:Aspartate aminotransferase [Spironucleus salmonicida]|eukprot:EST43933.1 Aspartate aminotransferase [Spironucleus salmonicida]
MSVFGHIEQTKPDPILNLNKLFAEDPNPKKVSLGVGAYRDEQGKPWILPSVRAAEEIISKDFNKFNKEYPPQPGFAPFIKSAQEFLLGDDHVVLKEKRVATCQSISGSGSLHVGFCFLNRFFGNSDIYLPSVTWPNHYPIFEKAYNSKCYKQYTYLYKDGTLAIDFNSFLSEIKAATNGSIFLLHACAHNPSGIDFTKEQWIATLEVFKQKNHIAFFDVAYQGFATGSFEDDGYSIRLFAAEGVECLIAQSFAKNFGLYGERIGAIHIVHNGDDKESLALQSNLSLIVRETWSVSPIHGAYIVQTIGQSPELKKQFLIDVQTMANRIKDMRSKLYNALIKNGCPGKWDHIMTCIGMFTFTGLTPAQVQYMKEQFSVYLVVSGGRMSMCGLTDANVVYVADAMKAAVENAK